MNIAVIPRLLTTKEAADLLNVSVSFVMKARLRGDGPRYRKVGRSVRYFEADVLDWLKARAHLHLGELGQLECPSEWLDQTGVWKRAISARLKPLCIASGTTGNEYTSRSTFVYLDDQRFESRIAVHIPSIILTMS